MTKYLGAVLAVGLLVHSSASAVRAQAADSLPLHVVTVGSGPLTIIVLHGGPGIRHNYLRPEWDALSDTGQLVYYDQRGCGLSTPHGPHHWRQHVADLAEVVRRVSPTGTVAIAGSSWGSLLALLYAHKHPTRVSALILSGLPHWPDQGRLRDGFSQLAADDQEVYQDLQSAPRKSNLMLDSAAVAESGGFHPALAPRIGTSCTGTGRATSFSLASVIPENRLGEIEVPVLIVHGPLAHPEIDGAASIGAVLPRAEIIRIEQTGHNPWVERPEVFFRVVREFLDRHSPR
jgi:pimeloyl-ACP methyl ester carboxylesterase